MPKLTVDTCSLCARELEAGRSVRVMLTVSNTPACLHIAKSAAEIDPRQIDLADLLTQAEA